MSLHNLCIIVSDDTHIHARARARAHAHTQNYAI